MEQQQIDTILQQAAAAFDRYRWVTGAGKAAFLFKIADDIAAITDELVALAQAETNLPEARLRGEIGRTTNQLREFSALVDQGTWVQATIDTALPERKPLPKPDLRKMQVPIGPVVVFGASNFPFAFSTAGGDTASALAAGCSVIVKSHPAHPRTSARVAAVIGAAVNATGMPQHVFQHIEDSSIEVGQQLVRHPLTQAVAFTGSQQGGMALYHLAAQRPNPIPVFAEMGSVNPVIVLPEIMKTHAALPATLAASIVQGVGQFCTNPGLLFALRGDGLGNFLTALGNAIHGSAPAKMLHPGIARNYSIKKAHATAQAGVSVVATAMDTDDDTQGVPAVARVHARDFIRNPALHEEVFGPFSLVVTCDNADELGDALAALPGQLTTSLFGTADELKHYTNLVLALQKQCGRMIFNGVPTGVEVCKAMQHGGPFPATTDARFTSVGTDALYRFVRPFCYQDAPEALLPAELRNANPLQILRCVNNRWTTDDVA
ncbi:aldehyde dehydrogenase (NADP(+)) [Dawidia soli]|uniref:Aldehyde dehydrogenase (NADP(+)) n=1 Tax=Dawidia soli TaxID=2782352 RepID=A0AAP2GH05_9BACT|nr:aldehyde dehydrogenase (NADP(+)) [Dawidia soli]MBT1685970.1 aldehyde dehydrogenase (NADP(+)) [Dawidia soli]